MSAWYCPSVDYTGTSNLSPFVYYLVHSEQLKTPIVDIIALLNSSNFSNKDELYEFLFYWLYYFDCLYFSRLFHVYYYFFVIRLNEAN